MSIKRRIASAAATLGVAAGMGLAVTAPAHAASAACRWSSNSAVKVCAQGGNGGYDAQAYFPGGSSVVGHPMDFTLVCDNGWVDPDSGTFYPSTGWYTYFWHMDAQGTCHVTLTDHATGAVYSSPNTYY
ncbi:MULTISPECIES: hypothetical protein [Streptomyces]|uniref:Secreted protein n=1 Tax=Streptomyces triticiradicis TaxID=2651189 RepID=A0A7J5D8F6_9ACTN|nr:hypothetical protein [Streptomyces triticiradicis]KAB1982819.1 hypothetical protein F8144_29830 [Streptomyces triticiradicis]